MISARYLVSKNGVDNFFGYFVQDKCAKFCSPGSQGGQVWNFDITFFQALFPKY